MEGIPGVASRNYGISVSSPGAQGSSGGFRGATPLPEDPGRCGGFRGAAGKLLIHIRDAGEECPPEGGNCVERNGSERAKIASVAEGNPPRARVPFGGVCRRGGA